jgi:radical SAM superfamily enzyme YgiQ (UPF0313 family)
MNVLLISANRLAAPYPVYPLGLDYVAASISKKHNVKIIDMNIVQNYENLSSEITAFNPDVVGISIRNVDNTDSASPLGFIEEYKQLVDGIKKNTPSPVVLGGSGYTIFPDKLLIALGADFGVIGEGEKFSLLLDAFGKKEKSINIPGIISNGQKDEKPCPWKSTFSRVNPCNSQHTAFYLSKGGMLNIQSKRGCPYKCVYCTYPHIEGSVQRLIPPNDVAQSVLQIQDAGAKYFFITDSAFNSDYEHSRNVSDAFIKAGVSIPWGAFFAPTVPPDDYYSLMEKARLSHVEFGTESLSDKMLAAYRKPFKTADVYIAHESAINAGLYTAHYLLLGGPGETRETLNETLSNAGKLLKTVIFFFCSIRIYPHTALYDIAVSEGMIKESDDLLNPVFYRSEHISTEEIIRIVNEKKGDRQNWIIGSGGDRTKRIIEKMYRRGHSGPLWEMLIQ